MKVTIDTSVQLNKRKIIVGLSIILALYVLSSFAYGMYIAQNELQVEAKCDLPNTTRTKLQDMNHISFIGFKLIQRSCWNELAELENMNKINAGRQKEALIQELALADFCMRSPKLSEAEKLAYKPIAEKVIDKLNQQPDTDVGYVRDSYVTPAQKISQAWIKSGKLLKVCIR